MLAAIERYKDRVIERAIDPRTRWKPGELETARRAPAEVPVLTGAATPDREPS